MLRVALIIRSQVCRAGVERKVYSALAQPLDRREMNIPSGIGKSVNGNYLPQSVTLGVQSASTHHELAQLRLGTLRRGSELGILRKGP